MALVVNVARHPIDLADGSVLAPGRSRDVDVDDPHNRGLLDTGSLRVKRPRGHDTPPPSDPELATDPSAASRPSRRAGTKENS